MEYVFEVSGMTCGHCERAVTNALHDVDAAAKVQIDRSQNKVVVESTAERETLRHAIAEEGYQVAA
ncbi:MAG: cation transporter [Acidovorax sp.]|jgi:copper chaperone|nr:cation transporter [Comamonas sp.]MDR2327401.1 cation transporter [Acidovorax sp.]MDR3006003.1 cation transporter [Acidovorax sp.]